MTHSPDHAERAALQQAWDAAQSLPPLIFTNSEADALVAALRDRDTVVEAIKARKAIYEQKRDASDALADDDSNRHERMQHTVEAFDYLLHDIAALTKDTRL
jgi:predicted DNA-binding transcriptional regulator YafY